MKKRILCAILLAVMLLSCLTGCGKKLSINLDGGALSSTPKDMETLLKMKPTKDGYEFAGWYADSDFKVYMTADSLSKQQKKDGIAFAKWVDANAKTYDVRAKQATVTDAGLKDNPMDVVYISDDFNLTDLSRAGYTQFEIEISMNISLRHEGQQHVCLYKNTSVKTEDNSVIGWLDKNLFGNKDEGDPNCLYSYTYDFSTHPSEEGWRELTTKTRVSFSSIEKDLYIRYDASGDGINTWYNKDVTVTVTPKK